MRYLALALIPLVLAGCAFHRAREARQARADLKGMSSEQILTCMGVPSGRLSEGQTEVWEYGSGNGQQTTVLSGAASGNFASGIGITRQRFCKIDLVMRGGIVQAVNYSGPTGGLLTRGEQCAYAVEACVKPR